MKKAEGEVGSFVKKVIDDQVKRAVLDAALHNPEVLYAQQVPYSKDIRGIFGGVSKGSEAQKESFIRLFDGV